MSILKKPTIWEELSTSGRVPQISRSIFRLYAGAVQSWSCNESFWKCMLASVSCKAPQVLARIILSYCHIHTFLCLDKRVKILEHKQQAQRTQAANIRPQRQWIWHWRGPAPDPSSPNHFEWQFALYWSLHHPRSKNWCAILDVLLHRLQMGSRRVLW